MLVHDLIGHLKKLPGDIEVVFCDRTNDEEPWLNIERVSYYAGELAIGDSPAVVLEGEE